MSKRCMGCMEMFGDEYEICPHCGYIEGTPVEVALHMEPKTLLYNRYIVGKVLGFGGFGVTYIGWDGKLEQKVAIKEYLPSEFSTRMPGQSQVTVFKGEKNEQFYDGMNKFVEEAKRLAKFQNEPGIVKVFDSFTENDTAYIIMEYLEGETLTERLKREKSIPEEEALEMFMPIMASLQNVHAEGILHRDIAPDNIFLTSDGEVKLIDFGASRYATTSHSRSLTVIIKPGYSPEEQYRSRGDQGPHTDVYALGATLYKTITGKTPPDAMERRAKFEGQNKDILEEPHRINKQISSVREVAILNAMNVRVEDRTPDIKTFMSELNAKAPAKRRGGRIKKIDVYAWPLWVKIVLPILMLTVLTLGVLVATGVIEPRSLFSDRVVMPTGVVEIPNVEGMGWKEAVEEIENNNLIASLTGNIESEYVEAGKIVLQTPSSGMFCNEYDTIELVFSKGDGQVIEAQNGVAIVPYLVGSTKEVAEQDCKKAGLGELVIETQYDENVAEGLIISQNPEFGTEVDEKSSVEIVISLGPKPFAMPSVEGQNVTEVESNLKAQSISVTVEYQASNSVAEGKIISQSVSAGTEVRKGDSVVIVVSTGKTTVVIANTVGMSYADAVATLQGQGLSVSAVENYSSSVTSGCVISQTPSAGSTLTAGGSVTLYVSKGKQPVTVSFNANGGSVGSSSATVYVGGTYGSLPVPTKAQHTFVGWYTSASGGSVVNSSTTVTNVNAHTLYAQWVANSWSEWTDTLPAGVSSANYTIETRTEYRYRSRETTSSSSSSMSGWTCYSSEITSWGEWSAWQNNAVTSSASRQVETQQIAATTKLQYKYYHWVSHSYGLSSYAQYDGTYSYEETILDSPMARAAQYDEGGNYCYNSAYGRYYDLWWNQQVIETVVTPAYTQYRYRDGIYTYYYERWGSWSSWSTTEVTSNTNTQVESRTMYRYIAN